MKNSSSLILLLFFVLVQLLGVSCRLPSAELSAEEVDIVDTLFNSRIPEFRLSLDSICKAQEEAIVKSKTDSLIELQLDEIRKLVERK